MSENSFGIYIQTYPGDFHLASMLVRSIQQVSPDIPIMIIPGEGFDLDDHPFDVPIMPVPNGFWAEIGHQDRDFWAFQGPFEKFLFLDADTICTKSLDGLARRIAREESDFIYIQASISAEEWRSRIENTENPKHGDCIRLVTNEFGTEFLAEFDPEHDFFAHLPFNSGVFASRRLAIKEADLALLNQRERAFYKDVLGIEDWTWKSSELFRFRDQGRLNYLVHKLSIPTFPLAPELIWVSGADSVNVSLEDVINNTSDFNIIHWMGAKSPSPSYFCKEPLFKLYANLWSYVGTRTGRSVAPGYKHLPECTGYSLWRHYYECSYGPFPLRERLQWSWRDLKRVYKLTVRWLRLLTRSIASRG